MNTAPTAGGRRLRLPAHPRNIWLLLVQNLIAFMGLSLQRLILNLYLVALGYREDFLGLVAFAGTIAIGVFALPASGLSNRFGPRRCLIAGTTLSAVGGVAAVSWSHPAIIVAAMVVLGCGQSLMFVPMAPFMMENASPSDHSRVFAANFAVLSVGSVLGSLVGGILPDLIAAGAPGVLEYRLVLLGGAAFSSLGAIALLVASDRPPSPFPPARLAASSAPIAAAPPIDSTSHAAASIPGSTGTIVAIGDPGPSLTPIATPSGSDSRTLAAPISQVVSSSPAQARSRPGAGGSSAAHPDSAIVRQKLRRDMIAMMASNGLLAGSASIIGSFYNVFLADRAGASTQSIGIVFALGSAVMAVMSLAGPAIAERIGTVRAIAIARLLAVPILLIPAFAATYGVGLGVFVARAMLMGISQPLDNGYVLGRVPPNVRARVAALRTVSWNTGWALAGGLGGSAIVLWGYGPIFVAAGALMLACVVVHYRAFAGDAPIPPAEVAAESHLAGESAREAIVAG